MIPDRYLPNDGVISSAFQKLADTFTSENKWPNLDLFGQYP